MIAFEVTIVLLSGALLALSFSHRIKQPIEVILLLGSLLVSLLPLPRVRLDPEVVFEIFLPPILFAAAYFTPWKEFVRNLRPSLLLAIGLVLMTSFGIAYGVSFLIPGIPWPLAFLLGAILAPPDASAAVALIRRFRLPRRLITVIEGESLINDATALTCYRLALAMLLSPESKVKYPVLQFLILAAGGLAVGMLVGYCALWLIRRLKNTDAEVLATLLTPFFCYGVAEHLHLSGVISTVGCGVLFGSVLPLSFSSQSRVASRTVWEIFLFAINSLVFTFIGLQLPLIVQKLEISRFFELCAYCFVLFGFLVVLRFAWVFPAAWIPRALSSKLRARDPMPSWQALSVISWTGMRGIVSLAGALAIPLTLSDGSPTPFRDEVIFLAYGTTLLTLLIPAFTIPKLLQLLKIPFVEENQKEESYARIKMIEAVIAHLEGGNLDGHHQEDSMKEILKSYKKLHVTLKPNLEERPFTELDLETDGRKAAILEILKVERNELARLRKVGELHDEVFHHLAQEIDFEELRFVASARGNLFLTATREGKLPPPRGSAPDGGSSVFQDYDA